MNGPRGAEFGFMTVMLEIHNYNSKGSNLSPKTRRYQEIWA